MQENRSPDNLFGSDAFAATPKLPGADLTQTGRCETEPALVTLQSTPLGTLCDPGHRHQLAWVPEYDNGLMDGACTKTGSSGTCPGQTPLYTYVAESDVDPYFTIAQQFGYGNYMFQTNQGPSFPAHQFLFSGTSAPDQIGDPNDGFCSNTKNYKCNGGACPVCHKWFAAENESNQNTYGCPATKEKESVLQIDATDNAEHAGYSDGTHPAGYPCYNHPSLPTLLDAQKISWGYYTHHDTASSTAITSLWTAPNSISPICGPDENGNCVGSDWTNYVANYLPDSNNYRSSYSPILTDLGADPNQPQCALPGVSWVVPDGVWSDHGGPGQASNLTPAGPSWVAAIINAVGQSTCKNPDGSSYWSTTAIIITWDDWGGWYDHVLPWHCGLTGQCTGYNDNNSGDYTYGFRVPLLVVSPYTGTWNGTTWTGGYLSGACSPSTTPCPNYGQNGTTQYVHDFGSILNFVEYVFGVDEIYGQFHYADFYAPDGGNVGTCQPPTCKYGLSDFFNFQGTTARQFSIIPQPIPTTCFLNPYQIQCPWQQPFTPSDPDSDVVDDD